MVMKDGYPHRYMGKKKQLNRESVYVPEHICIAEEVLGRKLGSDEDVHHLNGIKTDNRKENLMVCTHRFHSSLHNRIRQAALKEENTLTEEYKRMLAELSIVRQRIVAEYMQAKFGDGEHSPLPVLRPSDASYPSPIYLADHPGNQPLHPLD